MNIAALAPLATPPETPPATPPSAHAKATAARFEGLFMREMLKSMRAAKLGNGLLDSDADATWSDMRDQMFADTLAQRCPLGVAEHLPGGKA